MNVILGEAAEIELADGVKWYEEQMRGLGYKFAFEIHETVKRIVAFPKSSSLVATGLRRALVKKFPYGIIYATQENFIEIVAISNLHRKPFYWKSRISGPHRP